MLTGILHLLQYKSTKPEPRMCPVCGENVGISWQSLAVHVRSKHGLEHEPALASVTVPSQPELAVCAASLEQH